MYSHVFVAGTFDRIHRGHVAILDNAFASGEQVTIGLTSDLFVNTYKQNPAIQSFAHRKQQLLDYLSGKNFTLIAIDDPYEPAASDTTWDAIVVTTDNMHVGEEINRKRKLRGLAALARIVVPLVPAEDLQPISASRVRAGEIDVSGKLLMPDSMRTELAAPLGQMLTGDDIGSSIEKNRTGIVISVGDMTAQTLLTAGVVPNLIIVDFQVGRKPFSENDEKFAQLSLFRKNVVSGPGFIATEAVEVVKKWTKHPTEKMILAITGEEDLLTLPAVAYGPLGAVVYYGQPDRGMVEVAITPEKQTESLALLKKFQSS